MIDPKKELQVDQLEAFRGNIDKVQQSPNPMGIILLNEAWSTLAKKMCDELAEYKIKYGPLKSEESEVKE